MNTDLVKKRITSLVASAFVFNVLSLALRNFNAYMANCLKTNSEFSSSLNIIKTNLQVAFASIYSAGVVSPTLIFNIRLNSSSTFSAPRT